MSEGSQGRFLNMIEPRKVFASIKPFRYHYSRVTQGDGDQLPVYGLIESWSVVNYRVLYDISGWSVFGRVQALLLGNCKPVT